MTREEALEALSEIKWGDVEMAHCHADEVLCKLLTALGYEDVVAKWDAIPKWYA